MKYDANGQPLTDSVESEEWHKRYDGGYGEGRRWPDEIGEPDDPLDKLYVENLYADHLTPGETLGFPIYNSRKEVPDPEGGRSNVVYITDQAEVQRGLYHWNGSKYEIVQGAPGPEGPEGPMGPRGTPIDWDKGTSRRDGDGAKTQFTIPHDLGIEPTFVNVEPLTDDASVDHWVSTDDTQITIQYSSAPTDGNGNLAWFWAVFGEQISVGTSEFTTTKVSGNYSAQNLEAVFADASASSLTITLPSPKSGIKIHVKVINSSNDVIVETPGSETIDGQSSVILSQQFASQTYSTNGSDYYIL